MGHGELWGMMGGSVGQPWNHGVIPRHWEPSKGRSLGMVDFLAMLQADLSVTAMWRGRGNQKKLLEINDYM